MGHRSCNMIHGSDRKCQKYWRYYLRGTDHKQQIDPTMNLHFETRILESLNSLNHSSIQIKVKDTVRKNPWNMHDKVMPR